MQVDDSSAWKTPARAGLGSGRSSSPLPGWRFQRRQRPGTHRIGRIVCQGGRGMPRHSRPARQRPRRSVRRPDTRCGPAPATPPARILGAVRDRHWKPAVQRLHRLLTWRPMEGSPMPIWRRFWSISATNRSDSLQQGVQPWLVGHRRCSRNRCSAMHIETPVNRIRHDGHTFLFRRRPRRDGRLHREAPPSPCTPARTFFSRILIRPSASAARRQIDRISTTCHTLSRFGST